MGPGRGLHAMLTRALPLLSVLCAVVMIQHVYSAGTLRTAPTRGFGSYATTRQAAACHQLQPRQNRIQAVTKEPYGYPRSTRGHRTVVRSDHPEIGEIIDPIIEWDFDQEMQGDKYDMKTNKLLHSVYLVPNLEDAVRFCEKALSMKTLRRRDLPEQKSKMAFMGYGPEGEYMTIQLQEKEDAPGYDSGDGFQGYGISLPQTTYTDIIDNEKLRPLGGVVGQPMMNWTIGPNMIPDEDPSLNKYIQRGYAIGPGEVVFEVNNQSIKDPLNKVRLCVIDLEKSIEFYEALGMRIHQKRAHLLDIPFDSRLSAIMGYGETEGESGNIELIYLYNTHELDLGETFRQISVSTPNVTAAYETMKEAGYSFFKPPSVVEGLGTEVAALRDPNGYVVVLVSEEGHKKELELAASF